MVSTKRTFVADSEKGFTLIELLVVIGILAVLLAITLIAINPARQFEQANDTKRASDVNSILNAIDQYAADNAGNLPPGMPAPGASASAISNTGANICQFLTPTYIANLPSDPTTGSPTGSIPGSGAACQAAYNTGYTVSVASGSAGRVTVSATGQIRGAISVTE